MSLRKAFLDSVQHLLSDPTLGVPRIAIGRNWKLCNPQLKSVLSDAGDKPIVWSKPMDQYAKETDVLADVVTEAQADLEKLAADPHGKELLRKAESLNYSVFLLPPGGRPMCQFSPTFLSLTGEDLSQLAVGSYDSADLLSSRNTSFFVMHINLAADVAGRWIKKAPVADLSHSPGCNSPLPS